MIHLCYKKIRQNVHNTHAGVFLLWKKNIYIFPRLVHLTSILIFRKHFIFLFILWTRMKIHKYVLIIFYLSLYYIIYCGNNGLQRIQIYNNCTRHPKNSYSCIIIYCNKPKYVYNSMMIKTLSLSPNIY